LTYTTDYGGDRMALTEAQKKANAKWNKANMKQIAVNVRKEKAEMFQELARQNGTNPSAIFREVIDKYIEEHNNT